MTHSLLKEYHLGNYKKILPFLHPDITWIEAFHGQIWKGCDEVERCLSSISWMPNCQLSMEHYAVLFKETVHTGVSGCLNLTVEGNEPDLLHFYERATMIWISCGATMKLLHFHLSLPGESFQTDRSQTSDTISSAHYMTCLFNAKIEQLTEQLQKDYLTGVYLRGRFHELASRQAAKNHGAYLIIDLDNFKQINDNFGHTAGDRTLKLAAELLQDSIGNQGIIGRIGGDEFAIFLPGICTEKELKEILENIKKKLTECQKKEVLLSKTSFSIGIAVAPQDGNDLETLLIKADRALYRVKQNYKNGYCFYE